MENKETNQTEQSKKDISEEHLSRVDESLRRLENYERQLRTGHQDVAEYIQSLRISNPYIKSCITQLKTFDFLIQEFEIVFNNIVKIIPEEKLKELRQKLIYCREINVGKYGKTHTPIYDRSKDTNILKEIIFEDAFYTLTDELSKLRKQLINELSHLLWIGKEKQPEQVEG